MQAGIQIAMYTIFGKGSSTYPARLYFFYGQTLHGFLYKHMEKLQRAVTLRLIYYAQYMSIVKSLRLVYYAQYMSIVKSLRLIYYAQYMSIVKSLNTPLAGTLCMDTASITRAYSS